MTPCATFDVSTSYRGGFTAAGYEEVIVPTLWEQQTFIEKGGPGIVEQMYAFHDRKDRPIWLVPEVTGLTQQTYRNDWSRRARGPKRVFYVARCGSAR